MQKRKTNLNDPIENKHAGYVGYKRDIEAARALLEEEDTRAYWLKDIMIEYIEFHRPDLLEIAKKMHKDDLFDAIMQKTNKHAVGSYEHKVNFYKISKKKVEKLTEDELNAIRKAGKERRRLLKEKRELKKADNTDEKKVLAMYGSKNGCAMILSYDNWQIKTGKINGDYFEPSGGGKKKRVDGKYFYILKYLSDEEYAKTLEKKCNGELTEIQCLKYCDCLEYNSEKTIRDLINEKKLMDKRVYVVKVTNVGSPQLITDGNADYFTEINKEYKVMKFVNNSNPHTGLILV